MSTLNPQKSFKWNQFSGEIILWTMRWYCQFALSYRDLVRISEERGISISHTTIMRWIHQYGPELKKRVKRFMKMSTDSYRADETKIKIKGEWHYLYRAVDSKGNTLDWMISKSPNAQAAEEFFDRTLSNEYCFPPRVIGVDAHKSYPPAFQSLQRKGVILEGTKLRVCKYLNNILEQDHRFTKRRLRYSQWLQTPETADARISGYESMHIIRKGQVTGVGKKDVVSQKIFIDNLFGIAA